jgi:hypothetical protein
MASHGARIAYLGRFTVLAALWTLLPLDPGHAQASSKPRSNVAEAALPSVVTLRIYDRNGTQLGLGSGFFLQDGRIATNRHVIEGASWVEVYDQDGKLLGTAPYAEAISSHLDLAILPALGDSLLRGLPLAVTPPHIGESVWVIGSPEGLTGTVSTGVVSAKRNFDGESLLQVTAPISPGSSGGPVLDSSGRVVGISASILEQGQNLNFAVPVEGLMALYRSPPGHLDFPSPQTTGGASAARSASSGMTESDVSAILEHASPVTIPMSQDGNLTPDDFSYGGVLMDFYKFTGNAGEVVTLSMSSSSFDTKLGLVALSDSEDWSQYDDDGGGGTNSRLTATLPQSGPYLIIATSYQGGSGGYALSIADGHSAVGADGRWHYIGMQSDSTRWWWDSRSLHSTGARHLDVWLRMDPSQPRQNSSGNYYDEQKILYGIDCSGRRMRVEAYSDYFLNRMVDSGDFESAEWSHIPPNSMGEDVLDAVCE